MRVLGQVLRNQVAQRALRQGHRAADAQRPARLALHLRHRLAGGQGLVAHGHAVAQVKLARLGQRQFACGALQQPHAELGFELGHPAREPRFGQAQRPARRRKAAALGHLGEIQHVVQVLHGRLPGSGLVDVSPRR